MFCVVASCAYCSFNAECVYNSAGRYYHCQCLPGYTGNGRTCQYTDVTDRPETTTIPTTSTTTTTTEGEANQLIMC